MIQFCHKTGKKIEDLLFSPQRDVAQSGSVHVWGACGRRFKSCHPDLTGFPPFWWKSFFYFCHSYQRALFAYFSEVIKNHFIFLDVFNGRERIL